MFKIIIKKRPVGEFLASDGLIKVGFYHANLDPKLAWNTPDQDGKCWYYSNFGNLWCGSQTAPDLPGCALTPGFSPDDVVTAIVNINAGIAQFRKLTRIRDPTPGSFYSRLLSASTFNVPLVEQGVETRAIER